MPEGNLKALQKSREFFIAIDSDGCVFDTMEVKHKECFCPATVRHFNLQAVSKYAREAWEFVNLYSRRRGANRFPALVAALDLLRRRQVVLDRGVDIPRLSHLRRWIGRATQLGNPALRIAAEGDMELAGVLDWSEAVNRAVADIVRGVPPFPRVIDCLEKAFPKADMIVASGTPLEALHREWREHGIAPFIRAIAGQECGSKTEHLTIAAAGKYAPGKILMIGDAFGDLQAALNVKAYFYPILPGHEEASWRRFFEEALDRFFGGFFGGDYQQELIRDLSDALPAYPPWDAGAQGRSTILTSAFSSPR